MSHFVWTAVACHRFHGADAFARWTIGMQMSLFQKQHSLTEALGVNKAPHSKMSACRHFWLMCCGGDMFFVGAQQCCAPGPHHPGNLCGGGVNRSDAKLGSGYAGPYTCARARMGAKMSACRHLAASAERQEIASQKLALQSRSRFSEMSA